MLLVFCLYLTCLIYVDYVSCLNKVLILFLSMILFTMCLVFMSLIDYMFSLFGMQTFSWSFESFCLAGFLCSCNLGLLFVLFSVSVFILFYTVLCE